MTALEELLADSTAGGPVSSIRWTHRSLNSLRKGLRRRGVRLSEKTIARLLRARGFSLRTNRKRLAGTRDKQRDRQFRYLTRLRRSYIARGWPVISVDTKKKELVGRFKNGPATPPQVGLQPLQVTREQLIPGHPDDAGGRRRGRGGGAGATAQDRDGREEGYEGSPASTHGSCHETPLADNANAPDETSPSIKLTGRRNDEQGNSNGRNRRGSPPAWLLSPVSGKGRS